MQKKRPMLRRAWDLMAVTTIAPLGKVARKRISVCCGGGGGKRLLLLKRRRRLSLPRHYDYDYHHFIGEYEFSPDSTPLFPRGLADTPKKGTRLLRLLLCGSDAGASVRGGVEAIEGGGGHEAESPSTMSAGNTAEEVEQESLEAPSDWSGDETVDLRAERFIKRFYEEIKIQRQHSALEYAEMLNRSC